MYEEEYGISTWAYLSLCIEPTLLEGLKCCRDLVFTNIIYRIVIQYFNLSHNARHIMSFIFGSLFLFYNVGLFILWPLSLATLTYIVSKILYSFGMRSRAALVSLTTVAFILSCEIIIYNPKMWQQIRGIQMILCMKIISVVIECERGLYKTELNLLEYGGYLFCPANSFLGPWISFGTYNTSIQNKFILKHRLLKLIMYNIFLSIIFLILSNCIIPWYIDDRLNKWLVAFRDAQAFRMSHYFISRLSIVSMISAGFGLTGDCYLDLDISKPYYIELPRSLVHVVIYWNIPMHQWLKTYIFKTCRPYGQFLAIFITYTVSSILHGLNFQLSAVLLSIGMFSYVEYNLRVKLALALEVCCLSNECPKNCKHIHKCYSVLAIFWNVFFSLLTIIHLAYLGVMFEASFSIQESGYSYKHTLSKWENLDYFSHGFMGCLFLVFIMM